MPVTFKTKARADITRFGNIAFALLGMMVPSTTCLVRRWRRS